MNLGELQKAVHVAKDKVNSFGGYNYRTAEGILAAIKACLPDDCSITVTDDLKEVAGQIFVMSTAILDFGEGQKHTSSGFAMHPLTKKGMDPSQITGSASSYARKYALSGLVALDDGSADPDGAKEPFEPAPKEKPKPAPRDPEAVGKNMVSAVSGAADARALSMILDDANFAADFKWLFGNDKAVAQRVDTFVIGKKRELGMMSEGE